MSGSRTLLYPLDVFYARAGRTLPPGREVSGDEVPEPYRSLLVHDRDMTPTLEAFHGESIHLRVLARHVDDASALWREVVLTLDVRLRPVEFGAIVIHLQHFPPVAREEILGGWRPLGSILNVCRIEHRSCPLAYLCVTSDAFMNDALQLAAPQTLYGRRNVIWNKDGNELAQIVEILPPEEIG